MKKEKSCGAIVCRNNGAGVEVLLIKHRVGGHWSFPKGHMESGETELQTALREVKEETGLTIDVQSGFRESVQYYPHPNVYKQVVYFLAKAVTQEVHMQQEEVCETAWMPINDASDAVSFDNDRHLVAQAKKRLAAAPIKF